MKLCFHRGKLVPLLAGLCKKTAQLIYTKLGEKVAHGSRKKLNRLLW